MGNILTVASFKGGCGKTTLVTMLAGTLASKGYRVAMIDADPNATLIDWHKTNYEGLAIECVADTDHVSVIETAQRLAEAYAVVLIDTAGFANMTAASSIGTADAVLIPCVPDRGSVRETFRTVRQVEGLAKAARRAIPSRVVRSYWNARGLAEGATDADLAEAKVPLLQTVIPSMAAARQATFTGVVPEHGRFGETASALVAELARIKFIPSKKGKA